MSLVLRDYQLASIEQLRAGIRAGVRNQVLVAPTGAGKTVMAAHLLREALQKGRRAVFVADRVALINQTSAVLDGYGIDHGVIQGDHHRWRPYERIQVASAQTLARRGWPESDLIVVDECHTLYTPVVERIGRRDAVVVGLTATPFARGMGQHYDAVVSVTTTHRLMADGHLVPFRVFAHSEPDMTGARLVAGEWSDAEASARSMPIVGDCVAEYLRHAPGKKFIAFGCDVPHCEELQRQFQAAGVQAELYTYRTPDEARTQMVDEFRRPDSCIRGLISVSALSKGFDVPDVEVVILARPLRKSLSEHIQMLGRGLRPSPGKTECLVLDHAGNSLRFWSEQNEFFELGASELDDGKPKPRARRPLPPEKEPVKCPACAHVHSPLPACPACGHEYPRRRSGTIHLDGRLAELGRGGELRAEQQRVLDQLRWIEAEREYKKNWAAHKFHEKYGIYPHKVGLSETGYEKPSAALLGWVRSRQIAYAKSQGRGVKR